MNVTLEKLENLRQSICTKFLIITLFAIGIAVALIFIMPIFIPIAFVFWVMASLIFTASDKQKYSLMYKNYFVTRSLNRIFEDVQYNKRGIKKDVIESTNMINMGNHFESNDYVEAKYKGVNFCQSDVEVEKETVDSDGNSSTITLFQGRWLIFNFNKEFKSNVQVSGKRFGNDSLYVGYGDKKYKTIGDNSSIVEYQNMRYSKVKMESEAFNKMFRVYTQIEHDAFYILTPQIMEKLLNLANLYKGMIKFGFIDNKLHVAINDGRDAFEPASFLKKIDEKKVFERVDRQIKEITSLIDELNSSNDLFK